MLRSRSALSCAILFSIVLAGCSENGREPLLSGVEPVDIPVVDDGNQQNTNIANPTLVIPDTFPVADGDNLTLVFSEEFDGPTIDPEVWFFATGDGTEKGLPGGWGNNELQYYLPDSAQIVNGVLEITARRENVGGLNYSSARINTEDRFAFKYGRVEASIKMPSGQGLWPAFWMLSQDSDYVCDSAGRPCVWAAVGEIDIVEAINLDGSNGNEIFATIHYGGEFPANQSTSVTYTPSVDVTESFNTYAIEWEENEIRWYFNGTLYAVQNSWNSAALNGGPSAPFDQNFHLLLNLAVGGNFPGSPDSSTPFPATMEVDWVRVYSGEDPGTIAAEPTVAAPTPTDPAADVISLFSDEYTDIMGVDLNPNTGQATVFSQAAIAGNAMLKYAGLDTQTIDFTGNPQDVSGQGFLHVDVWTADSTELNVALASTGAVGASAAIAVAANSWVSVDIPLTAFAGVELTDVIQLIFDGNGTIFVDNIYFGGDAPPPATITPAPDDVIYATDPTETIDLITTITAFGTSSQFDAAYALDPDYNPAFEAISGSGYGLDHIVQLGFVGLPAGFADGYSSFGFKIKSDDLPGNSIEVKLEGGGSCGVIDLADTNLSTPLGNGWFEVVLPMSSCTGADTAVGVLFERVGPQTADGGTAFSFLTTDIGFNNATALPGIIPDDVIFASDPGVTVDLNATITGFGTSSQFDGDFTLDPDFSPAFQAQSGSGYGLDHIVQLGFVGLPVGFATDYESFSFKIKSSDLPGNAIEVKLEGGGSCGVIDLADTNFSTPLGNGWFQVVVPMSNCSGVATAVGVLFERVGAQTADGGTAFSFLATDIGFINASALAGTIPDDVIYATDPGEMVDLVATITAFGTSSMFDGAYALDADFNPSFQAMSGSGYGLDHIVQLGFVGLPAGFASGYESFLFKIKSADLPGNAVEVKLEGGATCGVIDLANTGVSTPLGNDWFQVEIPMTNCGGVATAVGVLFERVGAQTADGGNAFSMLLTDIGFNNPAGGGGGTELAVNGDFETGDFTSWQQAVNSGTQTISSDVPTGGGTASASLSVVGAGTTEIKQANLGAGTVAVGDVVTITFDVKGTFGPGGQLNVLSFTEFAGGGADLSNSTIIAGGVDNWTQQSYDVTLSGGDAGGGFSLAFNPVCGAVAGCLADVLIDNVSVVLNGTGGGGAAGGIVPDDVIYATDPGETVDLVATITAFGTSSAFDGTYALDADFNPSFQAQSGSGYGLDHIVQLGFVGLPAGFATGYESFAFKMKSSDLPGNAIEVKFEGGGTCGVINLSDTNVSTPLGNDWFQVVVPLSGCGAFDAAVGILFERVGPQTADGGTAFSFLATDIGFNNAGATGGQIPDDVIYATDPGETVDLVATITAFGTSSAFDGTYALDADFNPSFQAQSGSGYGLDHIVQLGFVGLPAGFATGYESFAFKMKSSDLPGNAIEVKFEGGGTCGVINLSDTNVSTPLGNDWFQVVVPLSGCGASDAAVGILFERVGPQTGDGGTAFSFLATDIGFNNAGTGGGGGGAGTELAVNGDFETSDFTGWQQAVNSGAQFISGDTPTNGGFSSAALSANTAPGQGGTTEIKQANLGAGTLALGDQLTITFDVKGTFGPAGQLNVLSFTEFAGGGGTLSDNTIITGGVDNWTTQTINVTLSGSDAGGGFSLAFNPVCGAVAGCVADVLIDNVSIVLN